MAAALNLQGLRALVQQHLTAALDELFGNLQKTFTEYDQELSRQRRLLDLLTEKRAPHQAERSVPSPAESVHSSRSDPRTRTPGTEGSSLCTVAVKTEEQIQDQSPVQNPLQIRVHSPVQDQDQLLNPILLTPVHSQTPDPQQDGFFFKAEASQENEMELDSDLVLDYDPLMLLVPDPEDLEDPEEPQDPREPAFRNHEDGFSSPQRDLQAVSFSLRVPLAWVQTLQIPWERTSPSLSLAMSRGERASAADRRALVRMVVDAMRQRCANPSRAACVEVAKMIVSNYPLTFADRTDEGEQLGTGYFSLLNQLKSRVDNLNRGGRAPLRRRQPRAPRSSKTASTFPQTLQKCKKRSYGCVSWQPALPQNESSSSLENKRKEMVEIFAARGAGAAETPRVAELMAVTYALQRRMINSSPVCNAAAVRAQFPFLFTKSCLNEHFRTLTGVDLLPRLREALLNKGARIRTFFCRQNRDQPQTRDQTRDLWRLLDWTDTDQRQTGLSALLLVMKHFLEREEAIFICAEPNASKASIESSVPLPVAPRIIAVGDSVLASRCWMVSLDRAVVFESESSFADALAVFFCCFYVFNLEYEEPACATLELIQRYFARINPAEGTKCTAKTGVSRKTGETVTRKTETINCRVASFLRRLSEPGLSHWDRTEPRK